MLLLLLLSLFLLFLLLFLLLFFLLFLLVPWFFPFFLFSSLSSSFILLIFVLNDPTGDFGYYYRAIGLFFLVHLTVTLTIRLTVLNIAKYWLQKGYHKFKGLIIGGDQKAINLYKTLMEDKYHKSTNILGFVYATHNGTNGLSSHLNNLGSFEDLPNILERFEIDEVFIAIESKEHNHLQQIMILLSQNEVTIKIMPDLYDIMSGMVRTSNVFSSPFIEITPNLIPDWERVIKRTFDILMSLIGIMVLLPVYIVAAINVRLSSPGPIFFRQKRIGKNGRSFNILKFRSMYVDAEKDGPALSSDNDPRITKWGKVMRKWRLDELPQLLNILIGDMSFVGPRPERKYFIDQICVTHPHYRLLHKVKPGLTSWGMVKFGYAENIEEMIERMKYDLLYIKNLSPLLDMKILIHTIMVIIEGRGK